MSEPTGYRVYPPAERPDVEVRVDEDWLPAEIQKLPRGAAQGVDPDRSGPVAQYQPTRWECPHAPWGLP